MTARTATPTIDLEDEVIVPTIPMSYEEYLAWCEAEEGNRGEWVDGEVIPFTTTSAGQQRIHRFLFGLILIYLEGLPIGEVFSQTFEMRSREREAREPDLMVLLDVQRDRLERVRIRGAADLAVEIVSPDSVSRDRRVKVTEYAVAGVPEYWVVDPREGHERLEVFNLGAGGEYLPVEPDEEGRLRSTVLPGLWVDPAWLVVDELPSVVKLAMVMAADWDDGGA